LLYKEIIDPKNIGTLWTKSGQSQDRILENFGRLKKQVAPKSESLGKFQLQKKISPKSGHADCERFISLAS
jgi:hypothetical protein